MAKNKAWEAYPPSYRADEMKTIAGWIVAGESGSVVGLSGCGRSNLLGFLSHRPDVLQSYLPEKAMAVAVIPVDIYNLPANDLSSLYRTILHAFYWVRDRFDANLQQTITTLYVENRAQQDPFLPQRALYDLLQEFQSRQTQVVLILNRFDRFCQTATPQMLNTMRGLRDSFKDTLCYIVGMLQDVMYLPDPTVLGDMYELLDSHVCWVGAMTKADARLMLERVLHAADSPPSEADISTMLALSGNFPVLLRAVGQYWLTAATPPPTLAAWIKALLNENSLRYRLERMWNGLTQEEQLALSEVQKLQIETETAGSASERLKKAFGSLAKRQGYALARLEAKGLCHQTAACWQISGQLLAAYVSQVEGRIRGKIWIDDTTRSIYQGQTPVEDLTPLEHRILHFMLIHPRIKHTRDDIIDNAWPEEEQREGITPNALQAHIASMRKKIEPNPAKPRYLITWHGRPGGYQLFPEGKPL